VKIKEKCEREKEKLKRLFRERESVTDWTNILEDDGWEGITLSMY
jgi:hypothetical protein